MHAAVQGQGSPVDERPCAPAQEQAGTGGVARRPDPAQGVRLGQRAPGAVQHRLHHLAREGPARERVDGDAPRAQGHGHGSCQVVQARLGRAVGVVLERGHAQRVDAAYVDDAGRGPVLVLGLAPGGGGGCSRGGGGLLEEGGEELGQGEDALEVEGQELGPGVVRVRVEGLAPGGARVVDQDVEALGLAARELAGEVLAGL